MMRIKKSPTADTRTCDWSKVKASELMESSRLHILDVDRGLSFFAGMLRSAAMRHDHDKVDIDGFSAFYLDFMTGFKKHDWWDNHRKVNRHHINMEDGIPEDVNLVDVLEHIVDCVMAGIARSGSVYEMNLPDELLQSAFKNTVELLKANVELEPEGETDHAGGLGTPGHGA